MRRQIIGATILLALLFSSVATPASGAPLNSAVPTATAQVSSEIPPVVVVLDLSGSMNEDDGTGLIKLTGAKKAVNNLVRSLPSSQPFGFWTYPGGSDDCGSGSFALPPTRITDLNGTIAKVDALTAAGGTPTGPALRSTADTLTAQGTKSATLVLISDGESNCGSNPCDVAKSLATSGFDVTIHTVGFRVSDQGRRELNCVASATGGAYVDVENGDELNQTLHDLTRAQLRVQTAGVLNPLAGSPARITVTVSNQSPVTASDAQVALQIDGGNPPDLNTLLRVGNVRPGASIVRTWTVGAQFNSLTPTSVSGQPADGQKFTVSAWANNADRVSADGAIDGSGGDSGKTRMKEYLGDVLGKPIDAGHPIVILGDSYSAGEGTFDYVSPPDHVSKDCHRSDKTYLMPELDPGDVVNLACSGAIAWDLYYSGREGTPSQLTQLAELQQAPGAAVMTLGGNDIGFAAIVAQCVEHSCDAHPEQVAGWEAAADSLRAWLAPAYEDVWKTINLPERRVQRDGTYAPVVVLAYPQVTHATQYGACGSLAVTAGIKETFGAGEVKVANDLAAHLNAAVKAAVADARDAGYEVYFVPDTADVTLPNHTVCDGNDAYINDVVGLGAPESLHPKASGYAAETGAIVSWSANMSEEGPDTSANGPVASIADGEPWSPLNIAPPGLGNLNTFPVFTTKPFLLKRGGYQPGTPVTIVIHSTAAVLKTLVADENGDIEGMLRVPTALELGKHDLVISGTNSDGNYREDHTSVTVLASPPLWVQLALPIAGVLLLAALVFATLAAATTLGRRRFKKAPHIRGDTAI